MDFAPDTVIDAGPALAPSVVAPPAPKGVLFNPDDQIDAPAGKGSIEFHPDTPVDAPTAPNGAPSEADWMKSLRGGKAAGTVPTNVPLLGFGDTKGVFGTVPQAPELPSVSAPGGPPMDVLSAASNIGGKIVSGLTSPDNLAIMAATGGTGKLVQRLVSGGFGAKMLADAYEQAPGAMKILDNPASTRQQKLEAVGDVAALILMGAGALKHAGTGEPAMASKVEVPPAEAQTAAPKTVAPEAPLAAPVAPAPVEFKPSDPVEAVPAPTAAEAPPAAVEVPAAPVQAEAPAAPVPADVKFLSHGNDEGFPEQWNADKPLPPTPENPKGLGVGTYARDFLEKNGYEVPETPPKPEPVTFDDNTSVERVSPDTAPTVTAERAAAPSQDAPKPSPEETERISSAAAQSPDGTIYTGKWHPAAYDEYMSATGRTREQVVSELENGTLKDGFLTTSGRFVDRDEAARVASKAEQFKPNKEGDTAFAGGLKGLQTGPKVIKAPAADPVSVLQAPTPELPAPDLNALQDQQTEAIKKMSESKLLALSKQLGIDPKGMSGDRLRARLQSNAHPEDIQEAMQGRGLVSGSAAEAWADKVLAKKRGQVNAGIDPEQFAAHAVKGAALLERGVRDFADWSTQMLKDFGDEIKPHLDQLFRAARDIHEQGKDASEATPEQLQSLTNDFRTLDPEKFSTNSAAGSTVTTRALSAMSSVLHGTNQTVNAALKSLSGTSAPVTSSLSQASGDALVRYASAEMAGPDIASSFAGRVLGDKIHDQGFANKLGSVLVEDRLRGLKGQFLAEAAKAKQAGDAVAEQEYLDKAQQVTSLVGKTDSPFKTEADFKAALADKDIKAAVERHKALVQPLAEQMHSDLGGSVAAPGANTKAFVNLSVLDDDGAALNKVGRGSSKGDLTVPLKKGSAFTRKAFGTAERYDTDYNSIVKNMITGNFEETAKRQMYEQLQKDGLGVMLSPSDKPPEINGAPPRKLQIERRGLGGRTLVRNLWVDRKIYPEVLRAMNLDETFKNSALTHLGNVLNTVQIKGPVDAVAHVSNILTSIAGSQGGKSVVGDLIRKLPGVNVVDAMTRVFLKAREVASDTAEVRGQAAEVKRTGAGRDPHEGGWLTQKIQVIDKAARLVRDDMYQNLVDRGLAKDSEAGRREFINQVGQYNPRLQGQIQAKLKELGASPFVVAGTNFNRNALRRVTGTPGITPASASAAVKLRAVETASLVAGLVGIPMAINYVLSGNPNGRPGTPFGGIDTGKTNDDGKAVVVDPQQWTGVRRGLRITGADAALSGQARGEGAKVTVDRAGRDIFGGFIHPYAGPLVNAVSTLFTGYNASQHRQAEKVAPGESQLAANALAAGKQLNPFVGNTIDGLKKDSPFKEGGSWDGITQGILKPLKQAAGIKEATPVSSANRIITLAHQFNDELGIPRVETGQPGIYSDVKKAVLSENFDHAQQAMEDLITRKMGEFPGNKTETAKRAIAKKEIADYFAREARSPFTGSADRERNFKQGLEADDLEAYAEARAQNRQMASSVRRLLYGQ